MYNQKPLLGTLPNYAHQLTPDVAAWLSNEGSGNKIYDIIGRNHGIFGAGTAAPTWVPGRTGPTLDFDGIDDFVDCGEGNGDFDFSSPYSLVAMIYPNTNAESAIIEKGYFTGNGGYMLWYTGDQIKFYIKKAIRSVMSINTGEWTRIVATWDGNYTRLYKNGILADEDIYNLAPENNSQPLLIGKYSTFEFDGKIEDVEIYNWALSASNIWQLHVNPYCWLAQPMDAELMYVAPPVGAIINQFQKANLGADLYDGVLIT